MLFRFAAPLFVAALLAPAVLAPAALAQTPLRATPVEPFKFLAARDIDALTDKPGPGSKTAFVTDHENYYIEYATRSDAGNVAEQHAHWTHYIQVLSGEATLTYGGTVSNPKESSPGQIHGDAIVGGTTMTVHAGDFVLIPAGMPHLFVATGPAAKFHYVVFNTRQ